MKKPLKKRASLRQYVPQNQLTLACFDSPFGDLDPENRWFTLSNRILWDDMVSLYYQHHPRKPTGRPPINPRILIGAVIIKHLNDYDDRETIEQIKENVYLQYFLGFDSFTTQAPFDASLFVDIRKKLTPQLLQSINERLLGITEEKLLPTRIEDKEKSSNHSDDPPRENNNRSSQPETHKGTLLVDATVAPQAIAYPTDLNLLNDSREMSEKIIDFLYLHYKQSLADTHLNLGFLLAPNTVLSSTLDFEAEKARCEHTINLLSGLKKPRMYRKNARKDYLKTAQNKKPSKKKIRMAVGKQIRYVRRNLRYIEGLLDLNDQLEQPFPLPSDLQRYYWIIQLLFAQQLEMFTEKKRQVSDRLVSIHQPHVRPIVRGKAKAPTEFGSKIHLSMIDGYCFLDTISWDAFNEGTRLVEYVGNYKNRYGYYPKKVLADKIYATRENRKWLKKEGIQLSAKPLGRPSLKAVVNHISPGERNPIEGKFGQAKTAYGMNRIRAKLARTSESWVASIVLVLNLVKWTRQARYCLIFTSFSNGARHFCTSIGSFLHGKGTNWGTITKFQLIPVSQGGIFTKL